LALAADRVRYTVGLGEEETAVAGAEAGHIKEVSEFRFFLYRHWSIFDAMYHSPYIASKMPVWQAQGTTRLKELLAKMGIPLYQCEQSYAFMAPGLKEHFRQQITNESVKAEYNLQSPDVTYRSFFRYNGFKNPVGASDVVYATSALLEMFSSAPSSSATADNADSTAAAGAEGVERQAAFNEAYDCLSMQSEGLLKKGVQCALTLQRVRPVLSSPVLCCPSR
jgi:cell division control protein 45